MSEYYLPHPMSLYLKKGFFEFVFEQQSILDAEFLKVANRQPTINDRRNSLIDEKGEFYNETKRESRYWANKVNDEKRLIEEYSDILHFYMGIVIIEVNMELDQLRQSGLLFKAQESEIKKDLILAKYNKVDRIYKYAADNYVYKHYHDNEQKTLTMDDMIRVLSIGRLSNSKAEILAYATLAMAMYGFSYMEIENEYNRVRENNFKRIERTRLGQSDR